MSIGERITQLRRQRNISQGQLADALEVSRQAVSKWENDLSSPDTLRLIKLAQILETDVEYLATGQRPVNEPAPVVVNVVEKVDRIVERVVEKPVVRKVTRVQYLRNPVEFGALAAGSFILGLILGLLL